MTDEQEARLRGIEEAVAFVGGLAERPYDNDPEFQLVLSIESMLRDFLLRERNAIQKDTQ